MPLPSDLSFFTNLYFWAVLLIAFMLAFIGSYWFESRRGRIGFFVKEANLKALQIRELEKINKKLEDQAKDLQAKEFELTLANEKLQRLEEAKSKFVSVTTHQLRTPLAAIKWTFNLILGEQIGKVNEEQRSFLEKGSQSTEKMISIVNDLLKVDLIEADKTDYKFGKVDIEVLLGSILTEFFNQAKIRQINLVFQKPSTKIPAIDADSDKLRIVFENLIDNAIKYSPENGEVKIQIKDYLINSARNSVEILIADEGIGIPTKEKDKIFQKFFRASNAIKQEPDGSGLGLFIARDIVGKHQGDIWYESGKKKGTVFHVILPVHRPLNQFVSSL